MPYQVLIEAVGRPEWRNANGGSRANETGATEQVPVTVSITPGAHGRRPKAADRDGRERFTVYVTHPYSKANLATAVAAYVATLEAKHADEGSLLDIP